MNEPLVSVPVITYNSAKYIIDGLESVKAQTYKNIELVISDDCSTDNTVEICQNWLEKNKDRFVRAILITTEKNKGVAGNLNNAICNCRGEWLKPLSGDDSFFSYSIAEYMKFILCNPKAHICFAKLKYNSKNDYIKQYYILFSKMFYYPYINSSQKNQFKEILRRLYIPGAGLIYKKELWSNVSGFDENYPFCEEDPFIFKVLKNKYKICYIDKELYNYNITEGSLSYTGLVLNRHLRDRMKYFCKEHYKHMLSNWMILRAFDKYLYYKILKMKSENKCPFIAMVLRLLRLTMPYIYIDKYRDVKIRKLAYNENRNTSNSMC